MGYTTNYVEQNFEIEENYLNTENNIGLLDSEEKNKYRKSLEIESTNVVSPNSKKLISDIAFFIDLENDFDHDEHREVLHKLLHEAYELLVQDIEIHKGSMTVNLAVIGNFSSGKSSFINSLIGKELCPVKVNPTTSSITKFIYSDKPKIMLPNENREISDEEYMNLVQHTDIDKMDSTKSYQIEYYYPFEEMRDITIYDTPGFNNPKNTHDEKVTIKYASEADIIFLVMDINNGDLDNSLLTKINELQKNNPSIKWHLIVNKADNKAPTSREKIIEDLKNKYSDKFDTIMVYSSKKTNMNVDIDKQLEIIYERIKTELTTSLGKKNPEINIHLSVKRTIDTKLYECHINNDFLGEFHAEKDIDRLKKNQKREVLSLFNDIGSNKYDYLVHKYESEFKLYEAEVKSVMRNIQTQLFETRENVPINENDESVQEVENILSEIKTKLKKKKLLIALFKEVIEYADIIVVDRDEKNYWSSPYWKWEYNYAIYLEDLDISYLHVVQGFINELENNYGLDRDREYSLFPNIEHFLYSELWDALVEFLNEEDTYYFDEEIDADLYKAEIYDVLNVSKAMDVEQKHFFDAIDEDIEVLRDILLEEVIESEVPEFDKVKQNEMNEKINLFLGEKNVK